MAWMMKCEEVRKMDHKDRRMGLLSRLGAVVLLMALAGMPQMAVADNKDEMTVKVKVSKALKMEIDESLDFGELFVIEAKAGVSASARRALSPKAASALVSAAVPAGMNFLPLGEEATLGKISVEAPLHSQTPFNVKFGGLEAGAVKTGADCTTDTENALVLEHVSGAPQIARFHVHDWVLGAGDGADSVEQPAVKDGIFQGAVTPSFDQRPVVFYLGATISTECRSAQYSDADEYLGYLEIEVDY